MNKPVENLIIQHLDTWTQATEAKSTAGRGTRGKINLLGIQKLRELILEMAVRGLLVPQDPNDDPASELLKKIAAEKAQLIKEGKIKKTKPLLKITDDEKLFDLPKGWEWVKLGRLVFLITKGTTPTSIGYQYTNSGVSFVKVENINLGRIDNSSISQFISDETNQVMERSQLQENDVLFSIAGTIGKTCLVHFSDLPANTNQALAIIRKSQELLSSYLIMQLDSFVAEKTRNKARGGAMPNVSLGDLSQIVLPVPPKNEQKRIVAKVDELMALCDQLENQTLDSIATHQTLVETLLGNLVNPENTANFDQAWSILAQNFDVLFTTEHSIDTLKQTLLQLAVMGKLVPQNPNDQPASELLKKIAKEKAQLIKQGKLKKSKPLPEITDDEKPFDLPDGWDWVRLLDIAEVFSGNAFKSEDFSKDPGAKSIKITNAGVGELIETSDYLPIEFIEKYSQYLVKENDLILALTRPYIADGLKISKCPSSYHNSLLNQRVAAIRSKIDEDYTFRYLSSLFVLKTYQDRFSGNGLQPNLKMNDVTELLIPVPPQEEQTRIVAKVNELMTLCDQLKTQLQTAQQTQTRLAQSIAHEALD